LVCEVYCEFVCAIILQLIKSIIATKIGMCFIQTFFLIKLCQVYGKIIKKSIKKGENLNIS
jgi:hypothetical protein